MKKKSEKESSDNKKTRSKKIITSENQTTDKKENDFPGYPHYAAGEDILDPVSSNDRLPVNVEQLSQQNAPQRMNAESSVTEEQLSPYADEDMVPGTEADVTEDDIKNLGSKDQDMDEGEDERLIAERGRPFDMTGEALDVPGSELDDVNENTGNEDEENNFYSRSDQ